MRVEIRDGNGCSHSIESVNPATIGLWFTEQAWHLMSVNAAAWQNTLIIYPTIDEERNAIGTPYQFRLTRKLLQDLAETLNDAR